MRWRWIGSLLFLALAAPVASADDSVRAALAEIRSPNALVRCQAASTLASASSSSERTQALGALGGALQDPVASVRQAAATSLGRLGDVRALPWVEARLDCERSPSALAALLLAVGSLGDARYAPRLASFATTHRRSAVRAAALAALGEIGGPLARRSALQVVARPGLPDPQWSLRAAAVLTLAEVGEVADVGAVLVAYRESGGERHWFARASLAKLLSARDDDPLPMLRQLVRDPDPRVAVTAAVGIARRAPASELLALLRHTSPRVRAAAASAAGRTRTQATYLRLKSMARFDAARRTRWAAALALFEVEDPLGDDLMLAGLASQQPTVWAEAIAALIQRTGESHGRDVVAWRGALRRWRAGR